MHGIRVTLSGFLLSPFRSPGGYNTDGVPADWNALAMMLLISAWRDSLPWLWRHDRPWWPMGVTSEPHKHWCGWTSSVPLRKPTAIRASSLPKRNPKAVEGRVWIQVPDGNELTASSLARPTVSAPSSRVLNVDLYKGSDQLLCEVRSVGVVIELSNRARHEIKPLSVKLPWSICRCWGKTLDAWTHDACIDAR